MNVLKILCLFLALCFIGTNITFAQSRAANLTVEQKEEIKKNVEADAATLQLSETQKPKFKEISKKYAEQIIALKDSDSSRMSKYKKMQSIRESKNAEMKLLLSKDQYKVYLEKQEEKLKKMKERRKQNK